MDNIISKKVNAETGDVLIFAEGAPGVSASIDSVEAVTLPAGSEATVENLGTEHNVHLRLGIPKGVSGNETIDDTKGEGDTDYVWSADKSVRAVNSSRIQEVRTATWEKGSITANTGINSNSNSVARTPGMIYFGRDAYMVTVTPKTGYRTTGRVYDKSDDSYITGITDTGFNTTGNWIVSAMTFPYNAGWECRFVVQKTDASTMVVENLPEDVLTFTIWRATDKNLTEAGVPADAEAVGKDLRANTNYSVSSNANGLNICDYSGSERGHFYSASGVLTQMEGANTTKLIKIPFGTPQIIVKRLAADGKIALTFWNAETGEFVSGQVISSAIGETTVTVPSDAGYLRIAYFDPTIEIIAPTAVSVLYGKKVSIFGDSISTYTGYIPEGNASYYPHSTSDPNPVNSVGKTWWKRTIDALGLELVVNNSWSGRAVSSIKDNVSGHATDAGYKEQNVLQLKNGDILPDIIIVRLGGNDFIYDALLGDYDGTTDLPTDPTKFLDAYAIMLNLIMTNFPLAEVYCCTISTMEYEGQVGFPERNANGDALPTWNNAIKKLANAFGAKVLDHAACGITYYNMQAYMQDWNDSTSKGLHPNAAGHALLANYTIHELDNTVRVRY